MRSREGVLAFVERLEAWLRERPLDPVGEKQLRVLASFYRAAAERDQAAMGRLLAEQARFEIYGAEGIPRPHARGRAAFLEGAELNFAALEVEPASLEIACIGADDDTVVVLARLRVRWGAAGALRDERLSLHFQLRSGRVVCFRARVFPVPAPPPRGGAAPRGAPL